MKEIRILLADDHSIVRTGIAAILGYEKDIAVVGEAEDGEEAIRLAQKLSPDLVLMELDDAWDGRRRGDAHNPRNAARH